VALLTSLVLALSFTPALAATVEAHDARHVSRGLGDRMLPRLGSIYTRGLRWTLEHGWTALAAGLLFVLLAVVAYRHVETGFVPEMDEGAFVLDYWSPPGTSLQETVRLLDTVDSILHRTPEVESFARRTGAELGFFLTETNRGDYSVRLRAHRVRGIEAIMDGIRDAIHVEVPALRIEFVQVMQDMIGDLSGTPSPVEIKVFGSDQRLLEQTARAANALIAPVPGVVDCFDGITELGPTYQVDVDEQRANLLGLTADAVQRWLGTAVTGLVVGQVLEGDRAIPLRLRYPDVYRDRLDSLDDLTMVAAQGRLAPLRSIARLTA